MKKEKWKRNYEKGFIPNKVFKLQVVYYLELIQLINFSTNGSKVFFFSIRNRVSYFLIIIIYDYNH